MALCSLGRSLRPASTLAQRTLGLRSLASASDQLTASQVFADLGSDLPEPVKELKDYAELPPIGTYSRGSRYEPLMNVPPPEDPLLQFLTSMIMTHGERAKARRAVARTLLYIHAFTRAPPLPILREAVELASPAVKTRSFVAGAKTVLIPMALSEKHRTRYGIKWLLEASQSRNGRHLAERLARECIDVLQRTAASRGMPPDKVKYVGALKQKQEVHTFAMVNRGGVKVPPKRGGQRM